MSKIRQASRKRFALFVISPLRYALAACFRVSFAAVFRGSNDCSDELGYESVAHHWRRLKVGETILIISSECLSRRFI
jgi:hypothetical protein